MIDIFDGAPESEIPLSDIISRYTKREVKKGDPFPEKICKMCLQDAQTSYRIGQSFVSQFPSESQIFPCQVKEEFLDEGPKEEWSLNEEWLHEEKFNISPSQNENIGEENTHYLGPQVKNDPYDTNLNESGQPSIGDQNSTDKNSNSTDGVRLKKSDKCPYCEKTFCRPSYLRQHIRFHTDGRPFKCGLCPNSYRLKSHLVRHILGHSGARPFKCSICENSFRLKSHLKKHTLSHKGERPSRCDQCEKSFPTKRMLDAHSKIHMGENSYQCSICEACFSDSADLDQHKRIHTAEQPFKNQRNVLEEGLDEEVPEEPKVMNEPIKDDFQEEVNPILEIAGDQLDKQVNDDDIEIEVKNEPIEDDFQGEVSPLSNEKLKDDEITKARLNWKNSYKCSYCQITFRSRAAMMRHFLMHTGERPFKCSKCSNSYKARDTLLKHIKTHLMWIVEVSENTE